jgi:hypothetical protein
MTGAARARRLRPIDWASLAVTVVFLALLARDLILLLPNLDPAKVAVDYRLYVGATQRFLEGGYYYLPSQLQGPYPADPGVILYPPSFIVVMAPFLVLPAWTYWALPIGAVVYAAWRHRPGILAWPYIAICLWFPGTTVNVVAGNPVLLFMGALALGTIWYWPAVLGFLKPSLLPFAFFGVWKRSWWVGLAVLTLVSLPFGAMWIDYIRVVLDARHPLGLLYNLGQVPMMLLPIAIWAGRRRPGSRRAGTPQLALETETTEAHRLPSTP